MASIEGFILTGGQSRRMGMDKSTLTINGQTFVERIAEKMIAIGVHVNAIGPLPPESQFRSIPDIYPNWGALGGVHSALSFCSSDWALVVACDYPFVTKSLFSRLIERCHGFDAVAPIQSDLVPQPLCSLYRVTPCLDRAEALIKSGERKPIALLQSVRTSWVAFDELNDLPGADRFFDNINSPDDYARIAEKGV